MWTPVLMNIKYEVGFGVFNKENEIEIDKCQKECLKDIEKLNNLFASKGEALAEGIFNNIIKE